jgi:hypothetical protein
VDYLEGFHANGRPYVDVFSVHFHLGLVYGYDLSLYLLRFEKLRERIVPLPHCFVRYVDETLYLPVQ